MYKLLILLCILTSFNTSSQAEDLLEKAAKDLMSTTGEITEKMVCFHENGLFTNTCRVQTASGKYLLVICNTTMTPGNNTYVCSVDLHNNRF